MVALPLKAGLTGAVTEATFKANLDALIDYLTGALGGGVAGADSAAMEHTGTALFKAALATGKPMVVRGVASQSENLQEWQSSSGTVLTKVGADGKLYGPSGGLLIGTSQLHVGTDGRIGIGTTTPGYSVHIVRTGDGNNANMLLQTDYGSFRVHVSATAGGSGPVTVEAASSISFKTGGTDAWALDSSGNSNFFNKSLRNAVIKASDGNKIAVNRGTGAPDLTTTTGMVTGELYVDETANTIYAKKLDGTTVTVGGGGSGPGGSYLPLSGGTITGALHSDGATVELTTRNNVAGSGSRMRFRHMSGIQGRIDLKVDTADTGTALIDISATFDNAAAVDNHYIRLFRNTKTTGSKQLQFLPGDGGSVSVGSLEVLPTEIRSQGIWNFQNLKTLGTYDSPFQIGTRRIWINAGILVYKDGVPSSAADGVALVPAADYLVPNFLVTPGSTVVAVPTGARAVYAMLMGGGGAGGGVKSTAANSYGGGGAGGAYLEAFMDNLPSGGSLTCVVGGGGAGASAANGPSGGDTKISIGAATHMTAPGGGGGGSPTSGNGSAGAATSPTVSASASAALALAGSPGKAGGSAGAAGGYGGRGAGLTAPNGYEGWGSTTAGPGEAATGYGHGGAGGTNLGTAAARAGGSGAPGYIALMWI